MPPLTYDPGSYVAGCNRFLAELGATTGLSTRRRNPQSSSAATAQDDPESALFVIASVRRLALGRDVTARDLTRLYDLRAKDEYNGLREVFCGRIDRYLEELRSTAGAERSAVVRDFENEFKQDRRGLRRELRLAGLDVLVNKESYVGLLTGGGVGAAGALAGHPKLAIGIGMTSAGAGLAQGVRRRRQEIKGEHWSSWLFSVRSPRLALF